MKIKYKILKSLFVLSIFLSSVIPLNVFALENENTYISYTELSKNEMIALFENGYKEIIVYNNTGARTSGTHSVTTCTSMKKKSYGWLGYSKDCFHETYTAVHLNNNSYNFSVSLGGVGVSFPVDGFSNGTGTGVISLTESEKSKVKSGSYYSCIRFKGYATWAKYSCKIYSNTSGELISTTSYTYTYTYKNNKNKGLDYYLEVRTVDQLNEIKNNKYIGTSSEKSSMPSWKNVPSDSSILP